MISTFLSILLLRLIVAQTVTNDDLPAVTKVTPNAGSAAGGMKLTVEGRNFASDQSVGSNEVILTNLVSESKCDVFILDSNTRQIVCYPQRGMEVDVTYWVKVKVNGEKIPDERLCNNQPYGDDCSFTPRWWNTPIARTVEPQTGMPGDDLLVKISGLIVTTRFGSGEDISANGREEKLVRVYGPGTCELKDGDNFYGLWVAADSFEGYMICKPTGSYVGCANMTFMVEAPFGRSVAAGDQLFASSTGQLCMIQYYTDVSSVSPAVGSTEGDLTVRITGSYYERGAINSTYNPTNSTYKPTRVYIGGTVCEITDVEKNEYIECTVAKQPDNMPSKFSGGRGVDVEIWEDEELADLDALEAAAPTTNIKHFDSAKFSGEDINAKQTRMIGRFIPPKSGHYAFLVKATYKARLSIDGVAQATSTGDWASGGRLMLVKDQPYQLMVAAMGPASNPGATSDTPPTVEAQARFYDEEIFTRDWTELSTQEEQIIRMSSTPTQDVQVLSFSQSTSQSWTAQKQRICIQGATFEISIGMFGAFTGVVGVDDATKVEEALNNAPYIDKDLENFIVEQIGEQCVEVTINSPRGDFPKFEVVGEDITADVSITTHGVPDNDFVSLVIGGRPSIPFLISELTAARLQLAANSMFEAICPDVFSSGNSVFESFEGTPSAYRYGDVVNEIEGFCGRQSIRNPKKIYPFGSDDDDISLKAMLDFHVCFAYSGLTNVSFVYKYRDSTVDKNIRRRDIDVVPLQEASEGNTWSYGCVNPYDTIDGGDLIEAKLEGVFDENFYVDAVYIGPKATFSSPGRIAEQRLRPGSPSRQTEQVLIDHVDVNYHDGTGEYEVTLYPLDCGYDFELFELLNKEGDSPTGESGSTTLSGGSSSVSVTRIQTASPPVQGDIQVSWEEQTSAIFDTTSTVEQIRNFLQGIPNIGLLRVEESKDSTCANKDLHVTFTSRAGDQEKMQLSYKEMRAPASADVEIVDHRDGSLWYNPILGDHLRTERDKPQVQLFINDVPSYCSGDCTFQWSADATPSIDSLDKNSGAAGGVLVISGTKFSAMPLDNSVLVGGVSCDVTTSTTTSITCTLGEGSGSNQPVQVIVAGKGRAAGSQTFTYLWEMTDFEPKSGSFGGGLTLTASGYGFPSTATVHVDDVLCPTMELTPTKITCTVPASVEPPSSGTRDVEVEVRVPTTTTVRKRRAVSTMFTFDPSITGIITLITGPQTLSVVGGDQLSVTGLQFGSDVEIEFDDGIDFVLVGSTMTPGSDGYTTVNFESPSNLRPGRVRLCVNTDRHGCAIDQATNASPFLICQLSVSSILPTGGSLYGGTVMTIRGGYFGTVPANVDVKVGEHYCVVSSVTNDQILCQIAKTARKKVITNGGKHGYDKYYAWDDDNAQIERGDTVRWEWTVPEFITYNRYRVIQTESESSETLIDGGIDSGPGTLIGAFEHTFTEPDVYHFWSGYIDANGLRSFRGKVTVTERASTVKQIVVKVMGWEAEYIDSGSSSPADSDSCSVTSIKRSCSDPIPVAPVSDEFKYYFIFSSCSTPMVNKMMITPPVAGNEQAITTSRHITVVGEGFASELCAVDAMLGEGEQECSCQTISSSETRAVFQPDDACTLPAVAVRKALSVLVKGRGYALVQPGKVALLPSITEISPNRGSKFGNTLVQIRGTGLKDVTSVMFNNIPALPFKAVSNILIECYSPNAQTGPVTVANGNFPGVCDDANDGRCYFHYDDELTPKVSHVVPDTISSFDSVGHTLKFTGTKFGTTPTDVTVFIGDVECTITSLSDTSIECTVQGLRAGENGIYMTVEGYGNVQAPQKITGTPDISFLSESSGSQHGGHLLVITGHGFHSEDTTVTIGGSACEVIDVTLSSLICVTPPHEVGIEDLIVIVPVESAGFPEQIYEFKSVLDGVNVSPKEGTTGETVTISGSDFGIDSTIVSVSFDDSECVIDAGSLSTAGFTCVLGSHAVGSVLGQVLVDNLGLSNTFGFTYKVALTSVTPDTGDVKGKQRVTISGAGFTADMKVTFGEAPCSLDPTHTITPSEIVCITPLGEAGACDINIISDDEVVETLPGGYTFVEDLSPIIDSVIPPRAGTGGGARIIISGSGFGDDSSAVTVTLEGSDCVIDTESFSDTEIQCLIPAQSGTVETEVRVTLGQKTAVEKNPGATKFWYIDAWSSEFTWNGPVPAEGEIVVVQAGHVLLLDEDTQVLAQLLILGGVVIFDCSKPVELKAKYIFITNGGMLQIGTENDPCLSQATITLYGHQREEELPIFGAKVIALYNGSLELHGKPIPTTWTTLSKTALKDAWEIEVPWGHTVNWAEGDEIVIATTGGRKSQAQNEKRTIAAITQDGDNAKIRLDKQLAYKHTGVTETYGDAKVEFRAEVGLLTRTVRVQGNRNPDFTGKIEACPDGFDTGEFAVQTCFQGRFGEEMGSDQFGAHIMVHSKKKDTQEALAHIEYIEVTYAGQAFHLGRYPIHFHLNGNMSKSYVRGCAIHETFNRAINLHDTHYTTVEKNVVYNIMGGAFFIEDGIETGNEFIYNLAIFVKHSSSLLNDDITPAGFWVTNANNSVRHNHAAGGTHFGFWYRMNKHPDGPSYTTSICPRRVPLGEFYNNTVHSQGWFGLWTFQEWVPMKNGKCDASVDDTEAAIFNKLTVWNCEKGAEIVDSGAMQFVDCMFANNDKSGVEAIKWMFTPKRSVNSPMVINTWLVGRTDNPDLWQESHGNSYTGVVVGFGGGFRLINTNFWNYQHNSSQGIHYAVKGLCPDKCGGYYMDTQGLTWHNVKYKGKFRWDFEGIIEDIDGTLTGISNTIVTPMNDVLSPFCKPFPGFNPDLIAAAECPSSIRFHRLAFNNVYPSSLDGKAVRLINGNRNVMVPYAIKRFTHKEGWMATLVDGETYTIEFENAEHLTNISFTGMLSEMQDGYVEIKIRAYERPDRFSLDGGNKVIPISEHTTLSRETAEHGQWTYDGTYVHFAMKGPSNLPRQYPDDNAFSLLFYKCAFLDCVAPLPDDELPLDTERPSHYRFWDSWDTDKIWKADENNPNHIISAARNYAGEERVAPAKGNDVTIAKEDWIVLRRNHLGDNTGEIRLGTLLLQGQLEVSDLFDDGADRDYKFFVKFIIIMSPGRLLFGWPDRAFDGKAEINLVGSIDAPYYSNNKYKFANVGAKAIGVFGALDLFGKDYGPSWTTLSATASRGDRTLQVDDDVSSWPVDGNIFITATGFNPKETEKLEIQSVSGQTITLKEPLQYTHMGLVETVNGKDYKLAAAVGLLTRNIKVQADEVESDHVYGGRIIASIMQNKEEGSTHTGCARVENVEFNRLGQDGFIEDADPRFAFTALSTGEANTNKPFKVSKCSFSTLYNSAIGLFGTKNVELSDNVVYESLGDSIRIASSSGTKVTHNLVSNMLATASYNGREEKFNIRFEVGMNLLESKNTEFERNYVAASEKGGYLFSGVDCDSACAYDDETSNIAASNSFGAVIFPEHVIDRDNCNKFCGLKLLYNFNYGFYYNNKNSVQISEMFMAGNQVGVFPMVTGPSSVGHICEHKTVEISNCVVLGHTSSPTCSEDNPPSGAWVDLMKHCKGIAGPRNDKIGLTFGQFSEGPNKAAQKPCAGVKKSDSICGCTKIKDVTLANFGPHPDSSCRQGSVAITTNPKNDDGQHPVSSERITRINVAPDSDVQFHMPNIGKVTPADCVDMHCDGLLKNFLQDLDGTLLGMGPNGAVISDSGYGWNVDLPGGRGDYRIPIKMMTRLDGSKIDIAEVRDEIGIPRIKDNCRAVQDVNINVMKCSGTSYKMLSIESLDSDTMSRRLSPVAFSQIVAEDKYIDLLNGPQDHGCCAGYSCQKRLSLFKAIVAVDSEDDSTRRRRATTTEKIVNEHVEIYLTSTPPERMRFLFVDPDETSCIVIVFFFWRPYRVDVLRDDGKIYVPPKNAEIVKDRLKYNYEQVGSVPTCAEGQGANYVDRDAHLIYFVLKGNDRIELKYREQVILSFNFPTLTPEEAFGVNIIENMAALLNVPVEKIRIVKIVAATGRRKRSTGSDVEVEIGNEPSESDDESSQADPTALAGEVMNSCQDNIISAALATDGITCSSIIVKDMTYSPVVPDRLEIYQELEPQHEGAVFLTQPKLRAYDSSGNVIQYLGIIENPWQMTATIRSNTGYSGAILGGTVTVEADNGWFNFTDLSISHAGTGYIIDFDITMPTAAADLNLAIGSASFNVDALPLKAEVYAMTSDAIVEDTEFSFTLELRDKTTDQPLEDIGWRGHVFDIECGLPIFNEMSTVSGNLNKTFDETSGRAQFDAVALSGYGPTYLECTIVSTPAEFNFLFYQKVNVIGTSQVGLPRDTSEIIVIRFKEDFTVVLVTDADVAQLDQMVLQYIAVTHPNIVIIDSTISQGSILITFTVEGSLVDVKAMTGDLCTDIKNGKSFTLGSTTLTLDTYMTVDGQDYYGVSCGASDSTDDGLHPGYIALIAVLAVLVLAVIVALLIWKMKVRPKTQTHEVASDRYIHDTDNGKTVYLGRGVTQEGTFTSMKSRENTLYHSHVNVDLRATPTPAQVDKMLYGSEATNLAVPPRDTWPHTQRVSPAPSPVHSRSSSPTRHDSRPMWKF